MRRIVTVMALVATPGMAEPGFGPGPNCFIGSYPAGSYVPSDLRELRFALDVAAEPEGGLGGGAYHHAGEIAVRFGPPALARREYHNWPVCWSEKGVGATGIERCQGHHDSEFFDIGWEGEVLVLTTHGLMVEQGVMPEIREFRIVANPGTPFPPEMDDDQDWLGPPVSFRLTRAPIAACAGIGPWDRDF